ncbi:MAG: serine/threonine-protein kinase, partial [Myxococcota bacterium]|nr:serine/threonine-protein kinase [Myxococcota bacterium]
APARAMNVISQVATALAYAHAQEIVHRDVKPANCMLAEDGSVKLMDFGIARRIQQSPSTERAKVVEGTPRYLAPEAAVGRQVDGRADIYSLGVMAFEMVTGRLPFYSETIRDLLRMHVRDAPPDVEELCPGLPRGLVEFIRGALRKRPENRLSDWTEIQEMLSDTSGAGPGPSRGAHGETEVVSITYPAARRAQVQAAVDLLVAGLSPLNDVAVSTAQMHPIEELSDPTLPVAALSEAEAKPSRGGDTEVAGQEACEEA